MLGVPILQALRGQLAFLARSRSISRENIMRFSREMEVILARNGSASRQASIDFSEDK